MVRRPAEDAAAEVDRLRERNGNAVVLSKGPGEWLGGCDPERLARDFGTPLLVIDEALLRASMRRFRAAFDRAGWRATVAYAGKALLLKAIARIACDEGLDVVVCSLGELATALDAGMPSNRYVLHGSYKTDAELDAAIERRVGTIVIDHAGEIGELGRRARSAGVTCAVMVRINPGISAPTHQHIRTAAPESKFGFCVDDGQAIEAVRAVAREPGLKLTGVHCHVGSQIADLETFGREATVLADFALQAYHDTGIALDAIDAGGGLAISDGSVIAPSPEAWAACIYDALERSLSGSDIPRPRLIVEPGRALIGPAGTTLYRIGVRKRLADGTVALIVDGGLSDNPRPALYEATYPVEIAKRRGDAPDGRYAIFGRHCETDSLFADVALPDPQPGDLLAVHGTGAYTYSMASNYNRFCRPAVVLASGGAARIIARRETVDRVLEMDVMN
ncbi:MAG TPA: diaminopimelate decarboxylase [Candidatus Eremiobacteraceae bacterium]|nr:diaminopimelate decarboxylase [Candidatus Eremiobacteraceae bacterium]